MKSRYQRRAGSALVGFIAILFVTMLVIAFGVQHVCGLFAEGLQTGDFWPVGWWVGGYAAFGAAVSAFRD